MKSENRPYRIFCTAIFAILFYSTGQVFAQQPLVLKWMPPYVQTNDDGSTQLWLHCEGCYTDAATGLPMYHFTGAAEHEIEQVSLTQAVYQPLSPTETRALPPTAGSLPELIVPVSETVYDRGEAQVSISFIPLRKNPQTGLIEKLVSCNVSFLYSSARMLKSEASLTYATTSVLSTGDWFRLAIDKDGIYQLTYNDLAAMGMNVQGLSSSQIRVHGYGGGMLPERAGDVRYDDIPELSVMVSDGGDGQFDAGDYLLFYAKGPRKWSFDALADLFKHEDHLYSEKSYYFVTSGTPGQSGKRMQEFPQPLSNNAAVITTYNWFDAYEPNEYSLIISGKEWYGDVFDVIDSRKYDFSNFDPDLSSPVKVRLSVAARSSVASSFTLTGSGQTFTRSVSAISSQSNTAYAVAGNDIFTIGQPTLPLEFTLRYNQTTGSSKGWLNFMEVNATGKLNFQGGQFSFRRTGQQGVVEYQIGQVNSNVQLWDVTDPLNTGYIQASAVSGNLKFKALADELREYTLCEAGAYYKPVFVEKTANQNLHGLQPYTMIIVTHPLFADQAERLATFHAQHDNMSVLVVQPQTIYNEFSSGTQDISAIRDFVKMMWHRSGTGGQPRYLLLFGDASYDPLERISGNSNFIPVFQSVESLHPVNSYATDDFFGCVDDNEGGQASDVLDIGVGRLPVQTNEEAVMAVDKMIHYATATDKVNGDWRNVIAFVADDEDGNDHMEQADMIATMIDTTYRNYNIDKIYFDAYEQISTPGGQRIPDATRAINQRLDKGALIVNYTGHGGEVGWAHERVLETSDINNWSNYDRLPVFMTATCEFSRFDDPLRVSAGELVFLNPKGGGIALFTTARPTFGIPNFSLARSFYNIALSPLNGEMPRLGDLIRISKRVSGTDNNSKKFVLLGDPALKMAYPQNKVITSSINGFEISKTADTLKALSEITITGLIADENNNPLNQFNGEVSVIVFDKESSIKTFGSDGSSPMTFGLRRSIIYKGKVKVENGGFTASFIVPLDIAYQYGQGKISYYATDGVTDAAGYYDNLVVGGFSQKQIEDHNGPLIDLYMNDENFRSGGFTDENPVMLAYLHDESGINTIGNSIGHDIVAILDEQTDSPYVLNDSYLSDLNTYKSGVITFPFHNLSPGLHTLRLKVWDVNNNSSEASTTFVVASSDELQLENLMAWPNPMRDKTTFAFDHNQAGQELNAQLDIYSLAGNRVASLNKHIFASGFRTILFDWDGRGSDGHLLTSGFYIGRLKISTSAGLQADKSVKILITR